MAGNWIDVERHLSGALTALQSAGSSSGPTCIAAGEQWVVFVWPGKNALDDTVLFSVVYPGVTPIFGRAPGAQFGRSARPRPL